MTRPPSFHFPLQYKPDADPAPAQYKPDADLTGTPPHAPQAAWRVHEEAASAVLNSIAGTNWTPRTEAPY